MTIARAAQGIEMKRCVVTFFPQAWINNYAERIDPQEGIEIDVTQRVIKMGMDEALEIKNDSDDSDSLVEGFHNHKGPFTVHCEKAVKAFFAGEE